jgi:hypothetical protein
MIRVILNDSGQEYIVAERHFQSAGRWARENCRSFQEYRVVDVSDASNIYDLLATYQFDDEADAVMFELKWRQS